MRERELTRRIREFFRLGSGDVQTQVGGSAYNPAAVAITGGNVWIFPADGSGIVATPVNAPADINEDTLATINLPPLSATASIRLTAWFTFGGSGNKTLRLWHGAVSTGTNYAGQVLATQSNARLDVHIQNASATNVQWGDSIAFTGATTILNGSPAAGAIQTNVATSLILTVQKVTAGDSFALKMLICEIVKP